MALLKRSLIALCVCVSLFCCSEDDEPDFEPNFHDIDITTIAGTTISVDVYVNGSDAEIDEISVVWSETPTVSSTSPNKLSTTDQVGFFHAEITGLKFNKTYYVKAFIATQHYGLIESELFTVETGAPAIGTFPAEGFVGEAVTFTGTGLSTNLSDYTVMFGDHTATVTEASSSQIKVIVPANLPLTPVRPVVKIQDNVVLTSGIDFTPYKIPVITSVSATRGFIEDMITVKGKYFSFPTSTKLKTGSTVTSFTADNSNPEDATLTFEVPSVTPAEYEVSFNMLDRTFTLPEKFTVLAYPWVRKPDFIGGVRAGAVSFTIGTKAYMGLGVGTGGTLATDFYEYDMTTGTWTKKADFPGEAREDAIAFMVGDKGYVGLGFKGLFVTLKDLWEYNPATNSWTQRADFAGTARASATAISIGSRGYVGLGRDAGGLKKDWWEYNPSTNLWTQRADFNASARESAAGFTIGSKGYVGMGNGNAFAVQSDLHEYDPATNSWTPKAFGPPVSRSMTFVINGKGYVAGGFDGMLDATDQLSSYDPATNAWTQLKGITFDRDSGVGFASSERGYIVTGKGPSHNPTAEIYEFTPY